MKNKNPTELKNKKLALPAKQKGKSPKFQYDDNEIFTGIFKTAIDAVITIDEMGFIESINPAGEILFGYMKEEVVGKNVKMLMPEPFKGEHDRYLENYRQTGVRKIIGVGREVIGVNKRGSTFPMQLSVSEAYLKDKRIFVGIARDISTMKNAEEKLRLNEQRSQSLIDSAIDAIVTINRYGIVEDYNKGAETLFEYTAHEVKGKNISMLMPEPFKSEHDGYLKNYLETGKTNVIGAGREVSARTKSGKLLPVHLSVSSFRFANDIYFTGIVKDLTQIKKIQRELKESEEKSRRLLDTAVDPIITIDAHGLIASFNESAVKAFGYTPDEVTGKNVSLLMPNPYKSQHDQYIENYKTTGVKKIIGIGREVVATRKDGSEFPIHLSVSQYIANGQLFFAGIVRDMTAYKAAELAIKTQNEELSRFRALVSTVSDYVILMLDEQGVIKSWNAGAQLTTGYFEAQALGKSIAIFYENSDVVSGVHTSELKRALKDGRFETEGYRVKRDGSRFYASVTMSPIRMASGELLGYSFILKDITDQKRIQDEIRISNEKLIQQTWRQEGLMALGKIAVNLNSTKAICDAFLDAVASHVHAAMGAFYLVTEDLKAQMISAVAMPKDRLNKTFVMKEGLVGQVLANRVLIRVSGIQGATFLCDSTFGRVIPREILVVPFSVGNDLIAIAELASLHGFEPKHLDFLEAASGNIAITINAVKDRERVALLLTQTQAQEEELRASNEELELKTQELQAQQEEMAQSNEELEEQRVQLEHQKLDLQRLNQDLEKSKFAVEEKARQLEISGKYKSEFLANMSHELRTPLNSILILSKILSENKHKHLDETEVNHVNTIHSSGSDLLNLINDVLDLSKVEAGKLDISIQAFNLNDFALSFKESFGEQCLAKNIEFSVYLDPKLPLEITSDSDRLAQIVKNFLSNAIKFTKKGSVKLEISRPKPNSKMQLHGLLPSSSISIAVKDTGIGIPEDKLHVIFEAFQQVDSSIAREFGGTGLGLSISKGLSATLGGIIDVRSKLGEGSVFEVIIPEFIEAQDSEDQTVELVRHIQSTVQPKILPSKAKDDRSEIVSGDKIAHIIEDDEIFAAVLADKCRKRGYKCVISTSGELGYTEACKYLPHIIILDIRLPDTNGLGVLDRLKGNLKTRHIPVHVISAEDRRKEAMRLGAFKFIGKPLREGDLEKSLELIEATKDKGPKKVLIVEDNKVERESISKLITGESVLAEGVDSIDAAMQSLKTESFDCVILDLKLGGESGFEFLNRLENDVSRVYPPIIIYTGSDLSRNEVRELERYSRSIIIKGAKSPERLVDELSIFIHKLDNTYQAPRVSPLMNHALRNDVLKNRKILIVDDDVRNIYSLRTLLLDKVGDLVVAYNGLEAVKAYNEIDDVDLILMDIMMPEMDGYQAITAIRQKDKKVPIIALTAKAMKGDREKCLAVGANDYLTKPIDSDQLLSLLRVWLS